MNRIRHALGFWLLLLWLGTGSVLLGTTVIAPLVGAAGSANAVDALERMGVVLSGLGALFVLSRALRGQLSASNFMTGMGMMLLGALLGLGIALRLLLPEGTAELLGASALVDGAAWRALLLSVGMLLAGVLLLFGHEFQPTGPRGRWARRLAWLVCWLFLAVVAVQFIELLLLEGINWYLPGVPVN